MLSHLYKHTLNASQSCIERFIGLEKVLELELDFNNFCILLRMNLLVLLDLIIEYVHFLFVLPALLHQVTNINVLPFDRFLERDYFVLKLFMFNNMTRYSFLMLLCLFFLFVQSMR